MKHNKLKLTIVNTDTNKIAEVHFPVTTPTRQKYFDSLELTNKNFHILKSNFHLPAISEAIMSPNSDLNDINFFAYLYNDEMDDNARAVFDLLIESKYAKVGNSSEILTLLNNLDFYYFLKNVRSPSDVANFYLSFMDNPAVNKKKAMLTDSDILHLGRDLVRAEEGMFYKDYYIGIYRTLKKMEFYPHRIKVPEQFRIVDSK